MSEKTSISGGCQCGAVRFHVDQSLGGASICHCRMCQKAFGGFFGPLVSVKNGSLTWTRGMPKTFNSSNKVKRGFCKSCGTPLTFEYATGVELAIGALDNPGDVAPTSQLVLEDAVPYFDRLHTLHNRPISDGVAGGSIVSNQHPDHDTTHWPASPSKAKP